MDALSAKLKTNMNNSDLGQTLQQITPMLKLQEKFTDVEAVILLKKGFLLNIWFVDVEEPELIPVCHGRSHDRWTDYGQLA